MMLLRVALSSGLSCAMASRGWSMPVVGVWRGRRSVVSIRGHLESSQLVDTASIRCCLTAPNVWVAACILPVCGSASST